MTDFRPTIACIVSGEEAADLLQFTSNFDLVERSAAGEKEADSVIPSMCVESFIAWDVEMGADSFINGGKRCGFRRADWRESEAIRHGGGSFFLVVAGGIAAAIAEGVTLRRSATARIWAGDGLSDGAQERRLASLAWLIEPQGRDGADKGIVIQDEVGGIGDAFVAPEDNISSTPVDLDRCAVEDGDQLASVVILVVINCAHEEHFEAGEIATRGASFLDRHGAETSGAVSLEGFEKLRVGRGELAVVAAGVGAGHRFAPLSQKRDLQTLCAMKRRPLSLDVA